MLTSQKILDACKKASFINLSLFEIQLLEKISYGKTIQQDETFDPKNPTNSKGCCDLRASLLLWIVTNTIPKKMIHSSGLRLKGANIVGELNFDSVTIEKPIFFLNCNIQEGVNLRDAKTRTLSFEGSRIKFLRGNRVYIDGAICLKGGFYAEGEVNLLGAKIFGRLDCSGGVFANTKGYAINAAGMNVTGTVFLRDNFKAFSEVRLRRSKIGGDLICFEGFFENKTFPSPDNSGNQYTINAAGLFIQGTIFLKNNFRSIGQVRLKGSKIDGALDCGKAYFKGLNDKPAIDATGISVEGNIYLDDGFQAEGEVRLLGAKINSTFSCETATFKNEEGIALHATALRTQGSVRMNKSTAKGEVRFRRAKIEGNLDCKDVAFYNDKGCAFDAQTAYIGNSFNWKTTKKIEGRLNLIHVTARQFNFLDNLEKIPSEIYLTGFTYNCLSGPLFNTEDGHRLGWLELLNRMPKTPFRPQPYEQLAKILRQMGHEKEGRKILIEKFRELRKFGNLSFGEKFLNVFLGCTTGHGWRPWLPLFWAIPFIFIGFLFFREAHLSKLIKTRETISSDYKEDNFSPIIYSLDVFLPVIDLHQEKNWVIISKGKKGKLLSFYQIFHIISGWVLSTLIVTSFTRLIRKD